MSEPGRKRRLPTGRERKAPTIRAVIRVLAAAGYSVIPTSDLERLQEIAADQQGLFPHGGVIKPEPARDYYISWSPGTGEPVWAGTRAQAVAAGCPPSRLRRADAAGTSMINPAHGYGWASPGMAAGQRGFLPRARLASYTAAMAEGRHDDARAMLCPFDPPGPG